MRAHTTDQPAVSSRTLLSAATRVACGDVAYCMSSVGRVQMIVEPELRVPDFAKAGADIISVHAEVASTIHLHRSLNQIKDLGCLAGAVLNPATPLSAIEEVLEVLDLVLIMSVNPGFGGQAFINSQVDKIRRLKAMCNDKVRTGAALPRHSRDAGARLKSRPEPVSMQLWVLETGTADQARGAAT